MTRIKNIVFDIGNVILHFDLDEVLPHFASNEEEKDFLLNEVIHSPEWLSYALIDTGFLSREHAISIVEDRTNHKNDSLIEDFWYHYNEYSFIDDKVLCLILNLKKKGYSIYLLSNINEYTFKSIYDSKLFDIVDGYVLSYLEHQVKPYKSIYLTLLDRFKLKPNECLFIDDNKKNVETARNLGMIGEVVTPDSYSSVYDVLEKKKINV